MRGIITNFVGGSILEGYASKGPRPAALKGGIVIPHCHVPFRGVPAVCVQNENSVMPLVLGLRKLGP